MANSPRISVFEYDSYKTYLNAIFRSEGPNRYKVSDAAEAAGCQRTYLSRVLNTKVHLTPDHAYALSCWLKHQHLERSYFLLLVERDRASSKDFKLFLDARLEKVLAESLNVSKKLAGKRDQDFFRIYFSSWHYQLVHLATSIPDLTSEKSISIHTGLSLALTRKTLNQLKDWGLIEQNGESWTYLPGNIHLERNSPLASINHLLWRYRAVLHSQEKVNQSKTGLHYTCVQTLSKKDFATIEANLKKLISQVEDLASPSKPEDAMVLLLDMFSPFEQK